MSRRTTVLTAAAVLACLLVPAGIALLALGVSSGQDGRTVSGIVLTLLGLVCLRVLTWARRIRRMTEAGLALHGNEDSDSSADHPPGYSQNGGSTPRSSRP
jgi:hypothetical protein